MFFGSAEVGLEDSTSEVNIAASVVVDLEGPVSPQLLLEYIIHVFAVFKGVRKAARVV
jgi:hypothetical protein